MLGNRNAVATLAVKDLETAKIFYGSTLGLTPVEEMDGEVVVYKSGASTMNVYRSQFAGTNQATAVTWEVDDVEKTVQALKAKGIRFEHYTLPGMQLKGDVHVAEGMKVAWFKDPDGNILNIFSS